MEVIDDLNCGVGQISRRTGVGVSCFTILEIGKTRSVMYMYEVYLVRYGKQLEGTCTLPIVYDDACWLAVSSQQSAQHYEQRTLCM